MHGKKLLIGAIAAAACGLAQAQVRTQYEYPADSVERGVRQLGDTPFYMTPFAGLAIGYDDNVLLTPSNEKTSNYWIFSPGINLDARGPRSVFQLKYQAQIARYSDSPDDNYIDQTGRVSFDYGLDTRNFVQLGVDYIHGHDPRGSTDRPVQSEPDVYQLVVPRATYAYGAPGARGRVELFASATDRRYLNNRSTTAASDHFIPEVGGTFYARVQPKTYVLTEVRYRDIDYKLSGNPGEGHELSYFVGATWEASAATSGTVKVGQLRRKTELGGAEDTDSSWEAAITWRPRTYSRFQLATLRQTTESTGVGQFIVATSVLLDWTHSWNSNFTTGVDLRYRQDKYQGVDRTDDSKGFGLRAGYKFRRWLTLGAEWTRWKRDSNQPSVEYDKNVYLLTATGSL
jgi:hypothetical protein